MSSFDYNDPIITQRRKGDASDPYIPKNETLTVDAQSYTVVLTEIPSRIDRVQVSGQGVTWIETQSGLLTEDQYLVDYVNKIVTFHSSRAGLQLNFVYKGTGLIYVPTSMIYTQQSGGTVTQTLDNIIAAASQFIFKGDYDNSTTYQQFNIVNYQGVSYSYRNTTPSSGHLPTDSTYWAKISGMSFKGTYNSATPYDSGDVVTDSNKYNIYQSLVSNNLNNALSDTSKWQLLITVQGIVDTIDTTNTDIQNAEDARVTAEQGRVIAESSRVNAESSRVTAEDGRVSAESSRDSNESIRESQESTRQSNESQRQSQETTRETNTANAIDNLNTAVSNVVHLGAYDNSTSYVVNNSVEVEGSTYRCIQDTVGNAPPNTTYWQLEAAAGSVASVTSANSDISVVSPTSSPVLTLNSSTSVTPNTIVKRDANGRFQAATPVSSSDVVVKSVTDTLDNEIGILNDAVSATPLPTPISLTNGQQVLNVTKAGMLRNFKVLGRTLINLLGRDGNFQNISRWNAYQCTVAADTSSYVVGTQGMKVTLNSASVGCGNNNNYSICNLVSGNYYLVIGDAKNGTSSGGVNFHVNGGGSATPNVTDTTKFTTVYSAWQQSSNSTGYVECWVNGNASGQYGYFGSARLFQIPQAEYNAIVASTYTTEQLAAKYPYVDDAKPLSGLYMIRYGENPIPDFSQWSEATNAGTKTINGPYDLTISKTATSGYESMVCTVPAIANQLYAIGFTINVTSITLGTGAGFYFTAVALDANGNSLGNIHNTSTNKFQNVGVTNYSAPMNLSTPSGTTSIQVTFALADGSTGSASFTNPRLNIGAVDKGFKPRNDDMMVFPVSIASNYDQSVFDEIYHDGEKYMRMNRIKKDMVLDGSLSWAYDTGTSGTEYKAVYVAVSGQLSLTEVVVKYDGKILQHVDQSSYATAGADVSLLNDSINIKIPSTDSGWGDDYTPTQGEIQAQRNGWVMVNADTWDTNLQPYNVTGTKGWVRRWLPSMGGSPAAITSSVGNIIAGSGVTTLPTTLNSGYTPDKLTYQLTKPTYDDLTGIMEGEINLLEGPNMVEVGAGMVLREKNVPVNDALNNTYINTTTGNGTTQLRYRTNSIKYVYRNSEYDANWAFLQRPAGNSNIAIFGTASVGIPYANYDPTATYEVTYQALDQYLLTPSAVTTITGEYDTNIKTVQDRMSQTLADYGYRLSVVEMSKAQKVQPQWIAPTLLNGWVNYNSGVQPVGYYKDDMGIVRIHGMVSSGTTTAGTAIFVLPSGYRPKQPENKVQIANDAIARISVEIDGSIKIQTVAGSTYLTLDITFLAEQ